MFKKSYLLLCVFIVFTFILNSKFVFAEENFDSYKSFTDNAFENEKSQFKDYKKKIESDFEKYVRFYNEEFAKYKQDILTVWDDFVPSTNKKYVQYSDDKRVRRTADFDNGEVVIEIIARDGETGLNNKIKKELTNFIGQDMRQAYKSDPVSVRLEKRLDKTGVETAKGDPGLTKLLSPVFDGKERVTDNDINEKAEELGKTVVISEKPAEKAGGKVVRATFKFKNGAHQKAVAFKNAVLKYAQKEEVRTELVFAVIHSESNFNPMAKSHVPAYGLMQIVPTSAGADAMKYLTGKQTIPSPSFLYNPDNNIKLGAAYLHVLKYRYFSKIKNNTSRLYCAIAAYNTGAGNVAYAFNGANGRYSLKTAIPKINRLTADQVYAKLRSNLRYSEARNYVKKVTDKLQIYK